MFKAQSPVRKSVDRFFPSSKTCHVCLNQVGSLPLDIRFWTCEKCQAKHDRDVNASINLKDEGLRHLLQAGEPVQRSGSRILTRQSRGCRETRPRRWLLWNGG